MKEYIFKVAVKWVNVLGQVLGYHVLIGYAAVYSFEWTVGVLED